MVSHRRERAASVNVVRSGCIGIVTRILDFWLERIHARYVVGHCQVSGWVHMRYPIEKYPGRFGLEFEDRRN